MSARLRKTIPAGGLAAVLLLSIACPVSAFDDLTGLVFVSNYGSNVLPVIDTRLDEVVARIHMPDVPDQVLISDERGVLIATSVASNRIFIVDLDTRMLTADIVLDFAPVAVRLGADGDVLAVASSQDDALAFIDVENPSSVRRVDDVYRPEYFTFDRDGDTLFAASSDAREVAVVDVAAASVVDRIALNPPPGAVPSSASRLAGFTRTPGGKLGFVLHRDDALMSVLNLRDALKIKDAPLVTPRMQVHPTANSQYLIAVDDSGGRVSLVSTWTLEESARLPGPKGVIAVTTAYFDERAFIISRKERRAVVIDLQDQVLLGQVAFGGTPSAAVTSADGLKLYVALQNPDRVAVVNAVSLKVIDSIDDVGEAPVELSMVTDRSYCH